MFVLLESRKDIADAQRELEATIRRDFRDQVVKNIGYPSGTTFDAKVSTDHKHWFWSADKRDKSTRIHRRLNWFGEFNEDAGLQITVEVNTPYEGRNDRIAGFFARDTGS